MGEEIDLRKYVEVLLRNWYWIVGLALLAAVAAFVYVSLQPPSYKASSVVLVKQEPYNLQFDSRMQTANDPAAAYKAFPLLATSDGILQGVVDAYGSLPEKNGNHLNLRSLANKLSAATDSDPRLIMLTARSGSGPDAIRFANLWADEFVAQTNAIYSQGEEDVDFFESQSVQAEQTLGAAETALIEFEARNEGTILQGQLDSLNRTQTDYLTTQRSIAYILQDIEALQAQLQDQPDGQTTSFTDSLTALFLQIRAFDSEAMVPIQLQIDGNQAFGDKSLAEQKEILDGLARTLEAKSTEIGTQLAELEPQILDLQQALQENTVQQDRLASAETIARDTYLTLARKLEEARIAAQEDQGVLQVGSYARPPADQAGSGRLVSTALAGMLGFALGVAIVLAVDYWRKPETEEPAPGT